MDNQKQQMLVEETKVKGSQLVDKVRALLAEGNARRVSIKREGRVLMEFPLSVGVGGAAAAVAFSPVLAAIGAFASLVSDVDVRIERMPEKTPEHAGSGRARTASSDSAIITEANELSARPSQATTPSADNPHL